MRVINPTLFASGGGGYLLDDYPGAVGAYSLQQLSSTEVDVVRVRRSSDDAESDFNPTEITDGTLTTWTGANDGFVTDWYDQSGSGNDLTQTTDANQPKIVSSGSLVSGGIDFDGSSDSLYMLSGLIDDTFGVFAVAANDNGSAFGPIWQSKFSGTSDARVVAAVDTRASSNRHSIYAPDATNRFVNLSSTLSGSTQYLHTTNSASGTMEGWINGASHGTVSTVSASGSTAFHLGYQDAGSVRLNGQIAELVVYAADKSSDRSGIESNINSRHSVY